MELTSSIRNPNHSNDPHIFGALSVLNVSALLVCYFCEFSNFLLLSLSESVETKGTMRLRGAVSSSRQQKTSTAASHRLRSLPSPSSPETAFVLIPQTAFGKMPFIHSRKKRMQHAHFHPPTALSFPSLTNRLSRMLFIHFRDLTVRPNGFVNLDSLSLINICHPLQDLKFHPPSPGHQLSFS